MANPRALIKQADLTRIAKAMQAAGVKEWRAEIEPSGKVAIIAGGDQAITQAVENAEDDRQQGWLDLEAHNIGEKDVVIGIAASGTTPYVISALEECKKRNIITGSITNNPGSPLATVADFPIEVEVGPEFVTGSTRMKSGTSQKLVLKS